MPPDDDALLQALRRLPAGADVIARSNQGMIQRFEHQGRTLAAKTATGGGAIGAANRWALRREWRAYERLRGVPGIPHCHGLVDDRWLVLDFVAGRPFRDATPPSTFFDRLLETIRAMHARGVAHGDLKRKANLMVCAGGEPVLLDFGAAVVRRDGFHPVNRRLFEFIRRTDLNAWVKLKYGGYEDVSEADRPLLQRSTLERVLARFRN